MINLIQAAFANMPLLHIVCLSMFISLLPLLDAHYNHRMQKPHLLSLAWITVGLVGLGVLVLLAFSTTLQSGMTFKDLLALQVWAILVILVAHVLLWLKKWLGNKK